jgi:leucyl/phenylalanyl-tRNA---protein transferase
MGRLATVQSPVAPPPSRWSFPSSVADQEILAGGNEVVGVGADLEPGTLLDAYRCGLFPMPAGRGLAWWSPDPRGVLPLEGLVVSRSLRRSCREFEVTFDSAFERVVAACADVRRRGRWINTPVKRAYTRLHELGWAHSVEVWGPDGDLAGGLYGVSVGALFAGESMFHEARDASKVALVALVGALKSGGGKLLDVQWVTPHLASLGAVAISRRRYHELLGDAIARPQLSLQEALEGEVGRPDAPPPGPRRRE